MKSQEINLSSHLEQSTYRPGGGRHIGADKESGSGTESGRWVHIWEVEIETDSPLKQAKT